MNKRHLNNEDHMNPKDENQSDKVFLFRHISSNISTIPLIFNQDNTYHMKDILEKNLIASKEYLDGIGFIIYCKEIAFRYCLPLDFAIEKASDEALLVISECVQRWENHPNLIVKEKSITDIIVSECPVSTEIFPYLRGIEKSKK